MLKEIKEGMRDGEKLKDIYPQKIIGKDGSHGFRFGKGDVADEGIEVIFDFLEISGRNKTIIKDGEFDLGKIKRLNLYQNAVELLPMLKNTKTTKWTCCISPAVLYRN
ncbi:MAG: uncharacterized protein A8A55_3057 [Amphiamblys sp. WSBS2006]|nr:MAG: uncharacterized protein A8A55_3057 [Amphiamblys sp. WSBS2006]